MTPYRDGREAYLRGTHLTENPYSEGTSSWKAWRQGWLDAEEMYKR